MPRRDPNRSLNTDPNRRSESDPTYVRTYERTKRTTPDPLHETLLDASAHGAGLRAITARELLDSVYPQGAPTADQVEALASLLATRDARGTHDRIRSIAECLEAALDEFEASDWRNPRRWPVIRTGERDPIPWPLRLSIYRRDSFTCCECVLPWDSDGDWTDYLELDHCIPWSAGGPDDSDNLRTLCKRCNQARSNYVDHAHERNIRPTTWWCIDCWSPLVQTQQGRWWRDGTDLSWAPLVDLEAPQTLAFCAFCNYISTTNLLLVGATGRELLEQATRFVVSR